MLQRRPSRSWSFLCAALFVAAAPSAQRARLSAPLVTGGDVSSVLVAPGGARTVYRADQDQDEVYELFATATGAPGVVWKLNDSLVAGGDVGFFTKISPDGEWVVYDADQATNGVDEIYSVPITGGTPVRLNGTLAANGDVSTLFLVSPDSSRVVYVADQDADALDELFSVPIGGGSVVHLNGTLPAGGDVFQRVLISPDSARVVYVADQDVNDRPELYAAALDGSAPPVKLNAPLVAGGSVAANPLSIEITPDSGRVVYRAVQNTAAVVELYSVPLDASAPPLELSGTMPAGGLVWSMRVSPDGTRVVYAAEQDVDDVVELYSVPVDGSAAPVQLNGPLIAGGDVSLSFWSISPDSTRVVYGADQDVDGRTELYSAPIDASAASVKLHPPLGPGQGVNIAQVEIAPDSSRVLFLGFLGPPNVMELWSAPLDGSSAAVKLNATLVLDGDVDGFRFGPGPGRVVYSADQELDGRIEIFSVPIDGSRPPRRVNAPLPTASAQVQWYLPAPQGDRVFYAGDQDAPSVVELFVTSVSRVLRTGH